MNRIPFDQFQRYNNVQKLVNALRSQNQIFRILEVGANEHQNLEGFLPTDIITYLDISLPKELEFNPKYILGDATQMEFEDNSYDIVVALDVFEHIPPNKRNEFVDELSRVSSQFFIITAPFYSEEVRAAENRLDTLYTGMFNESFIWLKEHSVNGLPVLNTLKDYLSEKGNKYSVISHGDINTWEKIMGIHFFAAKNPELIPYREKIDLFYNEHIFESDYSERSYRKIVVGSKSMNVDSLTIRQDKEIPRSVVDKLAELEDRFFELRDYFINESNKELVSEFRKEFQQLKENIVDDPKRIADELQVYVDTGNGFSEEKSMRVKMDDKNRYCFNFNLSEYSDITSLRIDPSMYAGVYKISNIKVDNNLCNMMLQGNYVLDLDNEVFIFENDDPFVIYNLAERTKINHLEFECITLKDSMLVSKLKSALNNTDRYLQECNTKNKTILEMTDQLIELKELSNNQNDHINILKDCTNELENEKIFLESKLIQEQEKNHLLSIKQEELSRELLNIYSSRSWKLVKRLKALINK